LTVHSTHCNDIRIISGYADGFCARPFISGSSNNDLVFINAGKSQGVVIGSALNIAKTTRIEGTEEKEKAAVFNEFISLVLVLQTLENTSMGLLVESKDQVEKGDTVTGKR